MRGVPTLVLLCPLVLACGKQPSGTSTDDVGDIGDTSDEGSSSSDSSGESESTSSESGSSESDSSESDSSESESSTEEESSETADGCNIEEIPIGGFVPDDDFQQVSDCDPWLQDCDPGEKCVPYSSGGGTWDANKCVPILGDNAPGEPCTSTGLFEATDDCDATSVCWFYGVDLMGECVSFCTGNAMNPICDPGFSCSISNQGSITLCIEGCDPLTQNCDEGLGCYFDGEIFGCYSTTTDIPEGDPCGYINDCEAGLMCVTASGLPSCDGENCCAAFCDLDCPICDLPGTECTALFEQGEAPRGQEDVGVCLAG